MELVDMAVLDTSSETDTDSDCTGWINWFCNLPGNEFFCEVDEDYIRDAFNLTNLDHIVPPPYYKAALDIILNRSVSLHFPDTTNSRDNTNATPRSSFADQQIDKLLEQSAKKLYGLIHARYLLTNSGAQQMLEKWRNGDFGQCARVFCEGQPVLPVGLSDRAGESTVKVYCPRCRDIYHPRSKRHQETDGAYFGTGFPHMLFMIYPQYRPSQPRAVFEPRLPTSAAAGSAPGAANKSKRMKSNDCNS